MDGERAPLRGASVKVAIFNMEVSSADGLRSESVEQRHLCP